MTDTKEECKSNDSKHVHVWEYLLGCIGCRKCLVCGYFEDLNKETTS